MFAKPQKFAQFRQADLSNQINRSRFFARNDNSIDDAIDLGQLKSSLDDSGRVSEDNPDYYKFKLKKDGLVKFNFRNSGDESIQFSVVDKRDRVISINGRRLFAEVGDGDKSKISARLRKGTFFLKVDTEEGSNERFNIKLKLESGGSDDDDNDDD